MAHAAPTPGADGRLVRRVWLSASGVCHAHLCRLSPESRYMRFCHAVDDGFIESYCDTMRGDVIVFGMTIDDEWRAVAELHVIAHEDGRAAELALSVEDQWQGHGIGEKLVARALLAAQNQRVDTLYMHIHHDNRRMLALARRVGARLRPGPSGIEALIAPDAPNAFSLAREWCADTADIFTTGLGA